ncbi:uncharacterized protein LOC131947978 [Physella acuta]|uniref:uncharacterized protein LOC131947978 n=1 Tax=Physella acuta TaxID=109671 RepID=UPI0027DD8BB6|nr:uncharacterized protein LOC131947978 [Physella acuta]
MKECETFITREKHPVSYCFSSRKVMARRPKWLISEIHRFGLSSIAFLATTVLVFDIFYIQLAYCANVKNKRSILEPYAKVNFSSWYTCPSGWELYNNNCYKLIVPALTWSQSQAVCDSFGGVLVKINSYTEQQWINYFVSQHEESSPVDDISTYNGIWIGLVHFSNQSLQWSDGEVAVKQDGFWTLDGLHNSLVETSSKLCCDIKKESFESNDLRWELNDCEKKLSSLCVIKPCENSALRCNNSNQCISKNWICDGVQDCSDGSDELSCSNGNLVSSQSCGGTLWGLAGSLQSPNYPNPYPSYSNCTWTVKTDPMLAIQIHVWNLHIEDKYDTIHIYDGSGISERSQLAFFDKSSSHENVMSSGSVVTINFLSDQSVQATGFNITWTTVTLESVSCYHKLLAEDIEKQEKFNASKSNLARGQFCDWLISAPNSEVVSLRFNLVILEANDTITVYDGIDMNSPIITHINSSHGAIVPSESHSLSSSPAFPSINIPPVIVSSGQLVLIHFFKDKYTNGQFNVSYVKGCGIVFPYNSSLILSPGYTSSQYPNNLRCEWKVLKDLSHTELRFIILPPFFTEEGKDVVTLQNSTSILLNMSGSLSDQSSLISSHSNFSVKFITDSTVNTGRWAAAFSFDCEEASVNDPLVINSTETYFGVIVKYSCVPGFTLTGSNQRTCGMLGKWFPAQLPSCEKIICGSPPIPEKAYLVHVDGITFGSRANYSCLFGYRLVGREIAECGQNGWENVPKCEAILCPKERPPNNSRALAEDIKYGYMRNYTCNEGFHMIGREFSHCNLSGQWSHARPICNVSQCAKLEKICNGHVNSTSAVAVGHSLQIFCDEGHQPNGSDLLTCLPTLQYDNPFPSCIDIDECKNPDACGGHLCQNYPGGFSCRCDQGYQHPLDSTRNCIDIDECSIDNGGCSHTCVNSPGSYHCKCPSGYLLYDGPWDHIGNMTLRPNKTCAVTCKAVALESGISVLYSQQKLFNGQLLQGTQASIICPQGHFPSLSTKLSCTSDQSWSPPAPLCLESACEPPRNISNGQTVFSMLKVGSEVDYMCDQGYKLVGPKTRYCVEDKNTNPEKLTFIWSGSEPVCQIVKCPALKSPENGVVNYTSSVYNSVAVFRCQCGHRLYGSSVLRCLQNGRWDSPPPTCQIQSCPHPGVSQYVNLSEYSPGFAVGTQVSFICKDGYALSDESQLTCVPKFETKQSILQPVVYLAVQVELVIFRDQFILVNACRSSYGEKMIEIINRVREEGLKLNVTHSLEISKAGSAIYSFDRFNPTMNITVSLSLTTTTTEPLDLCEHVQRFVRFIQDVSLGKFQGELAFTPVSCPEVSFKPQSSLTVTSSFDCPLGLSLNGKSCDDSSRPVCMEDCIMPAGTGDSTYQETPLITTTVPPTSPLSSTTEESGFYSTTASTFSSFFEVTDSTTVKDDVPPTVNYHTSVITDQYHTTTEHYYITTIHTTATTESQTSTEFGSYNTDYLPTTTGNTKTTTSTPNPVTSTPKAATSSPKPSTSSPKPSTSSPTPATSTLKTATPTEKPETPTLKSVTPTPKPATPSVKPETPTLKPDPPTPKPETPTPKPEIPTAKPEPPTFKPMTPRQTITEPTTPTPVTEATTPSTITPSPNPTRHLMSETPLSVSTNFSSTFPSTSTSKGQDSEPISATDDQWTGNITDNIKSFNTSSDCTELNSSSEHHGNKSSANRGKNANRTECFINHTKEKQTQAQEPTSIAVNLTIPFYLVEVSDGMTGSFSNNTCLNAVHVNVNIKVNELLREFGNEMGNMVCGAAPDASLELVSGNIKFKGSTAKIYLKFHIVYQNSSRQQVERCAEEFVRFTYSELQKKFLSVESKVLPSFCESLSYTGAEFKFPYKGWSCHSGYTLDDLLFMCLQEVLPQVSSTPVASIPRANLTFVGNFSPLFLHDKLDQLCASEYKEGLVRALTQVEAYIQRRYIQCDGIYIVLANGVKVTVKVQMVIIQIIAHLYALKEDISKQTFINCTKFLSIEMRDVSQRLPSLNLTRELIPICTPVNLKHNELRSDINYTKFYCTEDYYYDEFNFRCIQKSLVIYATNIALNFSGQIEDKPCENVIFNSARHLNNEIILGIKDGMMRKELCNTTDGVLILHKKETVEFASQMETLNIVREINYVICIIISLISTDNTEHPICVTLNLPLVLISLRDSNNDSRQCMQELFLHLGTALSDATSHMVDSVLEDCGTRLTAPAKFAVTNHQWLCLSQYSFDRQTNKCIPSSSQNSQQPNGSGNGGNKFGRYKRDASVLETKWARWNKSIPACIDVAPPVFNNCPDKPVVVPLNNFTQVPRFVQLPTASDNSGVQPTIVYTPSDFKLPYLFTKNTTLIIEAIDEVGNKATCKIKFIIEDLVPPIIDCPAKPLEIIDEESMEELPLSYKNLGISVTDNSGEYQVSYDPPEGTMQQSMRNIQVLMKAVDPSGNVASCKFFLHIRPKDCPEWSLPSSSDVQKVCEKKNNQCVCHAQCPPGKNLLNIGKPKSEFVCVSHGQWNYSSLKCAASDECPPGTYNSQDRCNECPIGSYQSQPYATQCSACGKGLTTAIQGTIYIYDCFEPCGPNEYSPTGLKPCLPCPVNFYQPNNHSNSCEECKQSDKCAEELCVPGTYSLSGRKPCTFCPVNYYTSTYGSRTCTECPEDKVTADKGASKESECKVKKPCDQSPCKAGTCQTRGKSYTCNCLEGYSGTNCEAPQDACSSLPCQNSGTCIVVGQSFTCICKEGYTGPTCSFVVDHCQSNPCIHGVCLNVNNSFKCICSAGYAPERCEQRVDACSSTSLTCHNGGTCVRSGDDVTCQCNAYFTGPYCEDELSFCGVNQCLNGGTCVDGPGDFSCSCLPGFTGKLCHINIDECTNSSCHNGGTCLDVVGTFSCLCATGYTGYTCDQHLDPCQSSPCQNQGSCRTGGQSAFICQCKPGYTGERCEQNIDKCNPMPCSVNGTESCLSYTDSFKCNCLPGWIGPKCETLTDSCQLNDHSLNQIYDWCSVNPCRNDGICRQSESGFNCTCQPGYSGLYCENNTDNCLSQPCQNNGRCVDMVDDFYCRCPLGFAGKSCQVDIDECLSFPCLNNGICAQGISQFYCHCPPGYTGKSCEKQTFDCLSSPCLNKGKCIAGDNTFHCECAEGFFGDLCENYYTCSNRSFCLNGGTCRRVSFRDVCSCTPYFTGPDCGKEKSSAFDLHFKGEKMSAVLAPTIIAENLTEFTVCLWSKVLSSGTFLQLVSGNISILTLRSSEALSSLFVSGWTKTVSNDRLWHHMCWTFNSSIWTLFSDGKIFLVGEVKRWGTYNRLNLTLGQQEAGSDEEWFKGHLHGVNIYSTVLNPDTILHMAKDCTVDYINSDLFNWVTADSYLSGAIDVVMPSVCNRNICDTEDCLITSHQADKTPPQVTWCPGTIVATNTKSPVSVTWEEPTFSDNVGVVSVLQNLRSGQCLAYGHNLVTYIAFDGNNNSAECSFEIFVRKQECIDPPPPLSGIRACYTWKHGRYCVPSCLPKYHFVAPIPAFYRCGQEGLWDPSSGEPFSFPACASAHPPALVIKGSVKFEGPDCSEEQKAKLKTSLENILASMDQKMYQCGQSCSSVKTLNISCVSENRIRREAQGLGAVYNVTIAVSLIEGNLTNLNSMPGEIIQNIKSYPMNNFTMTSDSLVLSPDCNSGQVLLNTDTPVCVDCPAGYYVQDPVTCSRCPKGQYNDKPLQTACTPCPDGQITRVEGATSISQCESICMAGSFNTGKSQCDSCPVGQYQDVAGQWSCKLCPSGFTTKVPGAKSEAECQDICGAGQQLGTDGTCTSCTAGTYNAKLTAGSYCTPCKPGFTTELEGAVSESQCNIVKCLKGHYKSLNDVTCHPCPLGTYQTQAGASSCEPCGINLTTEQEGADSKTQCVQGKVNECELKIDTCDQNKVCQDLDNGYLCECKLGKTDSGQCIDVCEYFCNSTKDCSGVSQGINCNCGVEVCLKAQSGIKTESIVIGSMTLAGVATVLLFVIVAVYILRKTKQLKIRKRIRIYREETELAAFTNQAYDSYPARTDVIRTESPHIHPRNETAHVPQRNESPRIPLRLATRWHKNFFVSDNPSFKSDTESTDL